MKTLKEMLNLMANLLSKPFYFLANLASLIGFLVIFIHDKEKLLISFIFFNILLLVLIGTLVFSILKLLGNSTTDFESKSTFIKYETLDGSKISYEVFKLIQCKRPILSEYEYNFKWSGTHLPKISSELQKVKDILDVNDPSNYDKAILKFSKPLRYNESCVINFKAEIDDADKKSETYISNRIFRPVDVIHYRIVLRHKSENTNAVIERRKIESVSQAFEEVKQVSFEISSKSYEYPLLNPELGYIYRIRWER
ncbi:MAG: hypothetical protein ACK46Y_17205, partial [Fluviicola sp.]|jgi:hypothetical protein